MSIILALILLAAPQTERGSVTGEVRLATGGSEAGIRVTAIPMDRPAVPATSVTELSSLTLTDAAGRYRLDNLAPGSYYITAGLLESPTYYPGAPTVAGARVVVVRAGVATEAVNFGLVNTLGMRVSGRIPKSPETLSATPVQIQLLGGTTGSAFEALVTADGTFQFSRIPPGGYTTRATPGVGLSPMNVVVTDKDVTGVNLPFADSRMLAAGFKVSGSVTGTQVLPAPPSPPAVAAAGIVPGLRVLLSAQSLSFEAIVNPDGSFEFRNVPSGTYTTRMLAGLSGLNQGVTIVVGDRDLAGVKISSPLTGTALTQVAGVVSVEDGSNLPTFFGGLQIQVRRGNGITITPVQSGVFSISYDPAQGYQISVSNLPLGYFVKSIDYVDTDLMKTSLKLGPPGAQIKVILGRLAPEAIRGVKVAGKLGPATSYPAGLILVLSSANGSGPLLETSIASDGAFEFAKTPPGTYQPRVAGTAGVGGSAIASTIIVGDQDILGLTINGAIRAEVSGRARFVDRNGEALSVFPSNVGISYSYTAATSGGSGGSSIRPDGTFRLPLPEGNVRMSADRLPDGYTLKSMVLGNVDLTKEPLKMTGESVSGVEVVIEFTGEGR